MKLKSTLGLGAVALLPFLITSCSSSSGGGAAGIYTINTSGGLGGATGNGGDGDYVELYKEAGPGNAEILSSGRASSMPAGAISFNSMTPTANLGDRPLAITADTTIPHVASYNTTADTTVVIAGDLYVSADGVLRAATGTAVASAADLAVADGTLYRWSGMSNELFTATGDGTAADVTSDLAAAGTTYMRTSNTLIYIADADDAVSDTYVTGISIASGATLTFELNYTSRARVDMPNDIANSGTITTADYTATDRGDLDLMPGSYIGAVGSSVNTAGSGTVINAGYADISADFSVYNHGDINTSGVDTTTGNAGDADYIYLYGYNGNVQNTGDMIAMGGNTTDAAGYGGDGGWMGLESGYGSIENSGDMTGPGGNGGLGGGSGDGAYFYTDYAGSVINSGDIDSSGGDGSAGYGGDGSSLSVDVYGGYFANTGNVNMAGGNTTEAASSAGDGGDIYIYTYDEGFYEYKPAGSLLMSGDIDLSGGDATAAGSGNGGNGGYVYTEIGSADYVNLLDPANLSFLGYTDINTSGGNGGIGGYGDDLDIYNDYAWDEATYMYVTSGNVINEANLDASGGDAGAVNSNGGTGGDVTLETDYYYAYNFPDLANTSNSGDLNTNGGNSLNSTTSSTGRSGQVWFWGYNGVTNTGAITANGGDDLGADSGTDGYGNYADDIDMYSELGQVSNTKDLSNNGGDGEYRGGYSNGIELFGATVSNSGNLSSQGGNAVATLANSDGGNGGWMELYSPAIGGVSNTGTLSNTGGTGATVGYESAIIVGGLCIGGDCWD